MYSALLTLFFSAFALLFSTLVSAVDVVAEGRALILDDDLESARAAAIQDAAQQASMQAAVYVSSNQHLRDGILEVDNMQIATLGRVSNIEVLDKKVVGRQYIVRIRAEVNSDTGCENGMTNSYMKTVAVAAFPLEYPAQANRGGLNDIEYGLARKILERMQGVKYLQPVNASNLHLHPNLQTAASRQLDNGALTTVVANSRNLNVQYVLSGVIRDMSMIDQRAAQQQNYFIDLYNQLDYKSRRHLRVLSFDLFLHDGYTGALLWQKRYQTAGRWHYEPEFRTGFSSAAFSQSEYGQKIDLLLGQLNKDVTEQLRCRPFTARIARADDRTIWITAGKLDGLSKGDRLTLYRRSTAYTDGLMTQEQLTNTMATAVVDEVQPTFATARLSRDSGTLNIREGDVVRAH
ncbi:MAG: flagellar assembly protein T N-terminal domain-containing protein [Marinobacterium sp.]|nr:flagellar assembly protein T N-terminal domain-containing protein [Marinobacterium sp.]